eukprot:Partr_v1_DN27974_c4_g1_i2_m11868 putative ATP-binding cassette, sub-family D (ALD), member
MENEGLLASPLSSISSLNSSRLPTRAIGLDILFIRRLARIIRLLFARQGKSYGLWPYYLSVLIMASGVEVLIYFMGQVASKFFRIFTSRDLWHTFPSLLGLSLLVFALAAVLKALLHYAAGRFQVRCRRLLTLHIHAIYFDRCNFYSWNSQSSSVPLVHSNSGDVAIDNPDQRISDDIFKFSEVLGGVIEKCAILPVLLVYYSVKSFQVAGLQSLLITYAYFFVSAFLSVCISNRLVSLTFIRDCAEGHFRYYHLRYRSFAESIAMLRGESRELSRINSVFEQVLKVHLRYLAAEIPIQIFSTFTSDFAALLSYLIISIPIMSGRYDDLNPSELSALISLFAFYSMYLLNKLTTITELFDTFASLAGYTTRIAQMLELDMREHHHFENNEDQDSDCLLRVDELRVAVDPHKFIVIPAFSVPRYSSRGYLVTISGATGSGKSTLFRVLSHLWEAQAGSFRFQDEECAMILPQQPYLIPNATLVEQLAYPHDPQALGDKLSVESIKRCLQFMGMEHLMQDKLKLTDDRLEGDPVAVDWYRRLSPGEQQKISFCRVLLMKPRILLMDESTTFMDGEMEAKCIEWCGSNNVATVWISHTIPRDVEVDQRLSVN